ncbi:cobalamin synthase [Shewanella mangrovi]|uniref:Adenosylcobinamide-GDP ribazoletransferase n=1 Tax=Shewanella mangrovi TaxID=1515746 RepID=A0A094JYI3_9GAMM|nr:adenosylcobinamide-GDP ribazoletransferase [Shewanella mangrovi]KFZ37476.1 cobalamin synthase [Shewanella mangrovi]
MRDRAVWLEQLRLLLIAIGFFTRIPVPSQINVDSDSLNRASRYFGLVGLIVGGVSALVMWLVSLALPMSIAIVLAMLTSVLLTGGFHEDGLADTADGFGGGWSIADKLSIMKDSRLGSYGALALVLVLLLKFELLTELALYDPVSAFFALILAHTLSRVIAASLIYSEAYVRDDGKSKPLAHQQSLNDLGILLLTGVLVVMLVAPASIVTFIVCAVIIRFALVFWLRSQIGGYTGDTLGAAQQLSELAIYILLLVGRNSGG